MSTSSSRRIYYGAWVEGVAKHIDDPVERLRFVRVAAPCGKPGRRHPNRWRELLLPTGLLVLVFLVLLSSSALLRLVTPARAASVGRNGSPVHRTNNRR